MLLELQDIKKVFSSKHDAHVITAVDGVDLSLRAGENLGIVGESGCGKTTLARIVMGLVRPESGRVLFEGQEVWGRRERESRFRQKVRMVFQDPFASLDPRFSVREILREARHGVKGPGRVAEEKRMREALSAVRLPDDILSRYPHEFSGGERQRVALARALMTDPSVLVLDEAVSSLDVLVQKEILDLLERLQAEKGLTHLFISHNLRVVRKNSAKIAVMYQGKIVEYGSASDIFDHPQHAYTKRLLSAALSYNVEGCDHISFLPNAALRDEEGGHWVRE